MLRSFWYRLIPSDLLSDPFRLRQANRVAAFDLAMLAWVAVFAGVYQGLDAPICALVIVSGGALLLVNLLALECGLPPALCGNFLCAAGWFTFTGVMYWTGGVGAPVAKWFVSMPIASLLLVGPRSGIYWTAVSALSIVAFAVARQLGYVFPCEVSASGLQLLQFSGLLGVVACVFLLAWVLRRVEDESRRALHDANRKLALLATTDSLTGIANRRSLDRALRREWLRHRRAGAPLSIALIDTDHFKQYNDMYGHLAGDECLRQIAETIDACIHRPGDMVARYGGEEFAVVLSSTDVQGAIGMAEEIQRRIRALAIPHDHSPLGPYLTVSIGLATHVPQPGDELLHLLRDADEALYRAKAGGRDRVEHILWENAALAS